MTHAANFLRLLGSQLTTTCSIYLAPIVDDVSDDESTGESIPYDNNETDKGDESQDESAGEEDV